MIAAIRAWADRHTSEGRYSPVGQIFHWTMAALVCLQIYSGWHMGQLPVGAAKLRAFELHAELGLLMLLLALLRLVWRIIVPGPINDADRLGWQTRAAYAMHIIFYTCFFGLPLSGWAMWSAVGGSPQLTMAGFTPWPDMPFSSLAIAWQWTILDHAEGIHTILVLTLLLMIPLHVGAALKHHFWDRHDVLKGMLPELPEEADLGEPPHAPQLPRPRPAQAGG